MTAIIELSCVPVLNGNDQCLVRFQFISSGAQYAKLMKSIVIYNDNHAKFLELAGLQVDISIESTYANQFAIILYMG